MLGLPLRRRSTWTGQVRDDHAVPWLLALRALWFQTLMGVVATVVLLASSWEALTYGQFGAAGMLLAVPFAVATSLPWLGRAATRFGLGRLPEETTPPPALAAAGLPALTLAAERRE